MQFKFIDPQVILFILANIIVAMVFFVGRDAEAASAGTSVMVIDVSVAAEVPCTPENSSYSEVCMDLDDEVVQVENLEVPTLWSRIVDILKFW